MKEKLMILIIALVCHGIACGQHKYQPIRSSQNGKAMSDNRYRLHEIIVIHKEKPSPVAVKYMETALAEKKIDIKNLKKRTCNSCDTYVELWSAKNIHTTIESTGLKAGTVSDKDSDGVGEDEYGYYSLNFFNSIPVDTKLDFQNFNYNEKLIKFGDEGRDTIRVAVLDTGIDTTRVVSPNLLWKNADEKTNKKDDDGNCYVDDTHGWNFINNTPKVYDDNLNLHGTLVSHYIINEFALSPTNFVQIMSLKTHDKDGRGDLFSSICALHYAMNKGANIINASWGFYYYQDGPHPYLDSLITQIMRKEGILFVTASGNQDIKIDKFARKAYRKEHGVEFPDSLLRNLEYHNFYPACLSREGENVITVTTTDGTRVSRTQNYSEIYVDVGVMRDAVEDKGMKFKTPFVGPTSSVSGSSFATAIACGKIGAYFPKSMYVANLSKDAVFQQLRTITPDGRFALIRFKAAMEESLIREGKMSYPK